MAKKEEVQVKSLVETNDNATILVGDVIAYLSKLDPKAIFAIDKDDTIDPNDWYTYDHRTFKDIICHYQKDYVFSNTEKDNYIVLRV